MMRVLDSGPMHGSVSVSQVVRGALLYARYKWWVALWLSYIAVRALYDLIVKNDGRSLMMYAFTALLLTFWWTYDPVTKRTGFRPEVGIGVALGFAFGVSFGSFNLGFFLLLTGFALAWPWILRIARIEQFNLWIISSIALTLLAVVFYFAFLIP
jgi:hypothetical protein